MSPLRADNIFFPEDNGDWFDDCDEDIELTIGYSETLISGAYPFYRYAAGSSCRYLVKAPGDYEVDVVCSINIPGDVSATMPFCFSDYLQLAIL